MEVAEQHEAQLLCHEAHRLLPSTLQPLLRTEEEQKSTAAADQVRNASDLGLASYGGGFSPTADTSGVGVATQKQTERLLLLAIHKYRQCLRASPDSMGITVELARLLLQLPQLQAVVPLCAQVVHREEAAQLLCSLPPPAPPLLTEVRALNSVVDLRRQELLPRDLAVLARALPMGAALQKLNLGGNNLSNNGSDFSGLHAFFSQLRLVKSLRQLTLAGCGLDGLCGRLLATALASDEAWNCCSLEELDVSGNKLGGDCFRHLAASLAPDHLRGGVFNTSLTSLKLGDNRLVAGSLAPLGRVLQGNRGSQQQALRGGSLCCLDLSGGKVTGSLLLGWAAALRDAVEGIVVAVEAASGELLRVNLGGLMQPDTEYSKNLELLPVVEALLEVSALSGLELDASSLKKCHNLKHVLVDVCLMKA